MTQTVHMTPLPPAQPPEVNTFKTTARLTFAETQKEHVSNTQTQPIYSSSTSTSNNINSSPQNNNAHPYDQSTVILQQFTSITWELRNFMNRVSGDITKITQVCTAAQENTGKLIENAISQALDKPQDVTPPNPTMESRAFGTNHTSNSS